MRHFEIQRPNSRSENVDESISLLWRKPRQIHPWFISLLATTTLVLLPNSAALAACVLVPSAGNTTWLCKIERIVASLRRGEGLVIAI